MKSLILPLLILGLMGCTKNSSNGPAAAPVPAPTPAPVADSGTGSSGTRGGGDVDVVNFLAYGRDIGRWFEASYIYEISDSDARAFAEMAQKLSDSMDSPKGPPVIFVTTPITDPSGAPKNAIFDKEKMQITVNRTQWKAMDRQQQYCLAALEIFGLIGLENRYQTDDLVAKWFGIIVNLEPADPFSWAIAGAILHQLSNFGTDADGEIQQGLGFYEWMFQEYIDKEAKSRGRYVEAAARYSKMPLDLRFDIMVTTVAKYYFIEDGEVGETTSYVIGMDAPSESLAGSLSNDLQGLNIALTLAQENARLSTEGQETLKEMLTKIEKLQKEISTKNQGNWTYHSLYADYFEGVANNFRKKVHAGGCKTQITSEPVYTTIVDEVMQKSLAAPDTDEAALYAIAQANAKSFQDDVVDLQELWQELAQSEHLSDQTALNIKGDHPYVTLVNNLTDVIFETTLQMSTLGETYKTGTVDPLEKAFNDGPLCRK